MRIPRFYIDQPLEIGATFVLPTEIHRHAVQVLRLKEAEIVILFNGHGGEYRAVLSSVAKRHSSATILSFDAVNRESPLQMTLALAMIKQDKMDFAIQKAVEMGVNQIQPLETKRSVIKLKAKRLEKKLVHWGGIIKAACEQSGRTAIPLLHPPTALDAWLQTPYDGLRFAMLPGEYPSIATLSPPKQQKMSLVIGPEGGFSEEEVNSLLNASIQGIQFGPRILRAETAVVAGIGLCQQQWGDLSNY